MLTECTAKMISHVVLNYVKIWVITLDQYYFSVTVNLGVYRLGRIFLRVDCAGNHFHRIFIYFDFSHKVMNKT